MSFGFNFVGTSEGIKRELAGLSERLTGQSKDEFDAVRPAVETIMDQITNGPSSEVPAVLTVEAHGHATFTDGVKRYGDVMVKVGRVSITPAF